MNENEPTSFESSPKGAEKQKPDQYKDWILTVYPMTMDSVKSLQRHINKNVNTLEVANLIKSKGVFGALFFIRKKRVKTFYVNNTSREHENIKKILLTFGVLAGAEKLIVLNRANIVDEEYSRWGMIIPVFKIFLWTLACFLIVLLKFIRFKVLTYLSPVSVSFKKIENILYLKTNLWFGVRVGGSVSHVAGVINGFKNLGKKIWFAGLEKPLLVDKLDRLTEFPFKKPFCYPIELNNYVYGIHVTRQLKLMTYLENKPDVIYQRMSFGNCSGVELSRKWKCPLILEYNGSEVWISSNWGRKPKFRSLALLAENINLKHAHLIVTVSEVLADELIQRGVPSEKIVCYPNGVDVSIFNPGRFNEDEKRSLRESLDLAPDDKVFTFIGTFGKWHGVDILAQTILELVNNHRSFIDQYRLKFLLVGDGSEMPLVKERLNREPYSSYVRFTGLIPQKETPLYLFSSDVLLSPHVPNSDGSRFFGSPIKIFEYMAMEKPIIASDLEQLSDLFKGSVHIDKDFTKKQYENSKALLVKPGDVESFEKAILYILNHESDSKSLGINARELVLQKHTWTKHIEEIIKDFEKREKCVNQNIKPLSNHWMQVIFNYTYLFTYKFMCFSYARKFFDKLTTLLVPSFLGDRKVCIQSRRGPQFYLKYPEDIGWESLIVHKDYELGTSDFIEGFLKEGQVVFDIGASLGWYTILAAKCVGPSGQVHGFEPVPKIFQKLKSNVELNSDFNKVIELHNIAITSKENREVELFSYKGLPHGLTSAKALYGDIDSATKVAVQTKTLDEIWKTLCCPKVDIIKVDVEGLEYDVVNGAGKLIKEVCPLWLLEINYQTSEAFQWTPAQLMELLKKMNNKYKFAKIHEAWGFLSKLGHSDKLKNGDILVAFNPDEHKIF